LTPDDKPGRTPKTPAPCPICGKPADPDHKPFCCKRCADVDLHRWLSNAYSIVGAPADDDPAADED
jgi:endogenous inhibitor of DNA gyrase (YacG/DUF329 family)